MGEKEERIFIKPPKNLAEMSDEEIYAYADVLYDQLVARMQPDSELNEEETEAITDGQN